MDTPTYTNTQQVRRAALLLVGGGATAAIVLALSRVADGFVGAGAFLIAIAVAAIAIGVAAEIVAGVVSLAAASQWSSDGVWCGSCAGRKAWLESVWVCPQCDHIRV
jgi:hypothetical protein